MVSEFLNVTTYIRIYTPLLFYTYKWLVVINILPINPLGPLSPGSPASPKLTL